MSLVLLVLSALFALLYAFGVSAILGTVNTLGLAIAFLALAHLPLEGLTRHAP